LRNSVLARVHGDARSLVLCFIHFWLTWCKTICKSYCKKFTAACLWVTV